MDSGRLQGFLAVEAAVLGVGNDLRGDDAAGSLVARALSGRFPDRVFDGGQAPENFLGPLRRSGARSVLIVDAADFGGVPGEVRLLGAGDVDDAGIATHGAPIGMLMRALEDELGVDTLLLAVQAGRTSLGVRMTEAVADACERIESEIARILEMPGSSGTEGERR